MEHSPCPDQTAVVRRLSAQATTHVGRTPDHRLPRAALRRITGPQFRGQSGWPTTGLGMPSEDTDSVQRTTWRTRAAYVDDSDEPVFEIDYHVCRRCRHGWVERPYTGPDYQGHGLAAAALTALRAEHPGYSWHTLGGHQRAAVPICNTAGPNVPGGYRQLDPCRQIDVGRCRRAGAAVQYLHHQPANR